MKVYMNGYKDNWISPYTILEKIVFWRDIDYDEPIIERWANRLVPVCEAYRWIANRINRNIRWVKIDHYDVWSMDHTLSHIIVPLLKELQRVKHGAPAVDLADVPRHLHPTPAQQKKFKTTGDTDPKFFERWDWVMGEMIWAHEQLLKDDGEDQFIIEHGEIDWTVYPEDVGKKTTPLRWKKKYKIDEKGRKAYQERIDNGLRLFGKYYRSLWD